MEKAKKSWLFYDALFMKITLWTLGIGVLTLGLAVILVDKLALLANILLAPLIALLYGMAILFIIHVIRFLKYLFKHNVLDEAATITRSIVGIFLTPISFFVYFTIILLVGISGCTITF